MLTVNCNPKPSLFGQANYTSILYCQQYTFFSNWSKGNTPNLKRLLVLEAPVRQGNGSYIIRCQ